LLLEEQQESFSGADAVIPFDGGYQPDQGELLEIQGFQDPYGLRNAVRKPLPIESFNPKHHSLQSIKAIFAGKQSGSSAVLIQNFEKRRLIDTGFSIFYSGNTFKRFSDAGLTLDTKLTAILEGDSLKFRSFHVLRRIFDLTDYFNEATDDDMSSFAKHKKLAIEDTTRFLESASSLTRKKIALIKRSGILDKVDTRTLLASARTFKVPVRQDSNGRILVPENKTELYQFLKFLDEDYYESALSQVKYISNSKRPAD
jgi:hypothetical protein